MNELEIALKGHDWSLAGYTTRPTVDQLMKSHSDPADAKKLWEQYCPWSDTNLQVHKPEESVSNV
jgi:hypothetical protein